MSFQAFNEFESSEKEGSGLFNTLLSKLPIELHVPGYNYLGPGTKYEKRVARGDVGINPLDEAAKEHDLAYLQHKDTASRHKADEILAKKAWNRVVSKDAKISERLVAAATAGAMLGKVQLGLGLRRRKAKKHRSRKKDGRGLRKRKSSAKRRSRKSKSGGRMAFKNVVKELQGDVQGLGKNAPLKTAVATAIATVRKLNRKKKKKSGLRVLPAPSKMGGVLPLIPFRGRKGKGLYLRPYNVNGYGLYLKPCQKKKKN